MAPVALPKHPPRIRLRHREALAVLAHLGFRGDASGSTFYEYIKSLRKLGTPFVPGTLGYSRRGHPNYTYSHLMELCLILTLRVYYIVPDAVLIEIIKHRPHLNRYYARAYVERSSGLGRPISVSAGKQLPFQMQGVFLDLRMNFSGGKLEKFGPPRLISPDKALLIFGTSEVTARSLLPVNLSRLSERLVSAALDVQKPAGKQTQGRGITHLTESHSG